MKNQDFTISIKDVKVIRSNRKTIAIQVDGAGAVTVRAPRYATDRQIQMLLSEKQDWIRKHQEKQRARKEELPETERLTMKEIQALADQAMQVLPERVAYYAKIVGVSYGKIMIRNQKTRWGSCSSKGNLNFNCLLMLMPPEVIDSVVVHELCHRKEMNHSARFYEEVYRAYPEYDKWNRWLKENGPGILRRMTG